MLSSFLKNQTKKPHQLLEKKLAERIKNISNEQDYITLLSLFYGFIAPLEKKIALFSVDNLLSDYGDRRKSAAISDDLTFLGADPSRFSLCVDLPDLKHTFDALGALYVLEGSTLGGQIISRMIKDRIKGISDHALSFFNSYGNSTIPMWGKFKAVLDKVPQADQQDVVESAVATFLTFKYWIETHE